MKTSEVAAFLEKAWGARLSVMLVGPPGCGKTAIGDQVARRLGYEMLSDSVPLMSPVKIGGYPRPPAEAGGDASHCLFGNIARAFRASRPSVYRLDDLGMGNGETLKAAIDLVYARTIDGRRLPECVVVTACSNDVGHGADVQGMIEPLKDRWDSIVPVEVDIDGLVVHGLAEGWDGWVLAWLRNYPGCSGILPVVIFDEDEFRRVMRPKFYIHTEPLPVPNAEHFTAPVTQLLGVDAESVDLRVRDAEVEARRELLRRLMAPVKAMAEKLAQAPKGDKDIIFRDTLVGNIVEIVQLAPKLNLTGDPVIDGFVAEVEKLTRYSSDCLRQNKASRTEAAELAADTLKRLSGYKI